MEVLWNDVRCFQRGSPPEVCAWEVLVWSFPGLFQCGKYYENPPGEFVELCIHLDPSKIILPRRHQTCFSNLDSSCASQTNRIMKLSAWYPPSTIHTMSTSAAVRGILGMKWPLSQYEMLSCRVAFQYQHVSNKRHSFIDVLQPSLVTSRAQH